MAQITAQMVSELRKQTGCGMMDCKKALVEADGNFDEAVKVLREKGQAASEKKQSRIAAEGLVDILVSGNTAAMIEVNSETDFVAKNASFKEFVRGILATILANKPADMDALLACKFDGSENTVEETLKEKIFTIGEKLSIRRFIIVEGVLSTYIHGMGTTGVIVKLNADAALASDPAFAEMAKNLALQIAAGSPPSYVNKEDVPDSAVNEEKEILIAQIKNDPKNASKPEAIIEKMVAGRLGKFYERTCLVEQPYVKDDDISVGKYIESVAKQLGATISVDSFYLFEKGEGIQKREENFAEEIAKMVNK